MKYNRKNFLIAISVTVLSTLIIILGIFYGLQWMPKGSQFSFDTLGVFLGAVGSVGAIVAIWYTTRKQVNEQNKIQKQNVRIQLFEKRYEVYTKVVGFINSAISDNSFSLKNVNLFHDVNRQAVMIFENDITEYIENLRVNGNNLAFLNQNDLPGSIAEMKHFDEKQALLTWFTEQQKVVVGVFKKYLDVNKLGL